MCFRRWRPGGEVSRGRQGDRAAQTGVGEGTSALGRARQTPGQGGGTSDLGRPRRTPGQGGGTSGRAPQATAGAPGAQGARPQRPLRLDLNPLLSPEASVSNPYRPISALEPVTFGNCRCANLSRTVLSMGPGWVHWTRPPSPLVPRSLGQGEELGWLLKPGPGEGAEGAAAGGSSALRGLGGGPRALRRQVFTGPCSGRARPWGPSASGDTDPRPRRSPAQSGVPGLRCRPPSVQGLGRPQSSWPFPLPHLPVRVPGAHTLKGLAPRVPLPGLLPHADAILALQGLGLGSAPWGPRTSRPPRGGGASPPDNAGDRQGRVEGDFLSHVTREPP